MSPRLLVTDPSRVFRRSLRELVATEAPGWEIVGEAATGREAVSDGRRLDPDVVLLERRLREDDGLQVLTELREACPGTAVIMISIDWEPHLREAALEHGARRVLLKQEAADELVRTLREIRGELEPEAESASGSEAAPG